MARSRIITALFALVACVSTALAIPGGGARNDFQIGLDAAQSGDFATAFTAWMPLAKDGDREAQYNIGLMYRKGNHVERNDAEALNWFRAAAEQGLALAQCHVGYMYANGLGHSRDLMQGAQWSGRAAAGGSAEGRTLLAAIATELGWVHIGGEAGFERDLARACMWFSIGADSGDPHAPPMVDSLCGTLDAAGDTAAWQALKARCVASGFHDCVPVPVPGADARR